LKIKNELITKVFILSGLMNIFGVLIFSRLFNNPVIVEFDSKTLSNFGLLMIVIWGFAYISVSKSFYEVKWLIGIFAIEKLVYAIVWTSWQMNNNLFDVFEKDKMAGIFYSVYGLNDWIFFFFFLLVFVRLNRTKLTF
jgi:hypothetical protein